MTNIEQKVEKLISNTISNLGYKLYDVIYAKEGQDHFLRIFIDKDSGISLDDCEIVSNAISDMLDEANYIKEQYFLEVSSAGVERILRKEEHFKAYIGKDIEIKLFKPIQKSKLIIGELEEFDENRIIIKTEDEILEIKRNNIALVKTVYKW